MNETQILHDLIDYENDFKWFLKENKLLKEKYSGKVILVKDKDVKAVGETIEEIEKKALELKIDISRSVIQFISKEDITMII